VPYAVATEQFSGPLDLLLQLIEKEELDISKISLAKVTEDYLAHLNLIEERRPSEMADFLVVATRLLYLKSSLLLPEPELEQESGFDLETQLKIYRDFMAAAKLLDAKWKESGSLFMRERPYALERTVEFLPPPAVTAQALFEAFKQVIERIKPFSHLEESEMRRVVTLAEKMAELEKVIHERSSVAFHELIGQAQSKGEVVVSFLALLELVKQRAVHVEQEASFCDILIKKVQEKAANL